jgi:hypothetical protein
MDLSLSSCSLMIDGKFITDVSFTKEQPMFISGRAASKWMFSAASLTTS